MWTLKLGPFFLVLLRNTNQYSELNLSGLKHAINTMYLDSLGDAPLSCYLCGKELIRGHKYAHKRPTIDHKIPVSRGGAITPDNLAVCCQKCNNRKGSLTEVEYLVLRNTFLNHQNISNELARLQITAEQLYERVSASSNKR